MNLKMGFIFSLALAVQARAEITPILAVHADYYPERDYALGLDVNTHFLISRVYFQDENGEKTFYSLKELEDFTPIFSMMGESVVKMRIARQEGPQSAIVELQILRNYFTGATRSVFFAVQFNSTKRKYEIIDLRDQRPIRSVTVETRYAVRVPVGIEDLDTE